MSADMLANFTPIRATAILGPCRHRYGPKDLCGITVMDTRYGPGHSSAPRVAHYPVLPGARAALEGGEPIATSRQTASSPAPAAGRDRYPGAATVRGRQGVKTPA